MLMPRPTWTAGGQAACLFHISHCCEWAFVGLWRAISPCMNCSRSGGDLGSCSFFIKCNLPFWYLYIYIYIYYHPVLHLYLSHPPSPPIHPLEKDNLRWGQIFFFFKFYFYSLKIPNSPQDIFTVCASKHAVSPPSFKLEATIVLLLTCGHAMLSDLVI